MPLYDYECPKCGKELEILKRISDNEEELCPDDETPMIKVISKISVRKGAGIWSHDVGTIKQLKDES